MAMLPLQSIAAPMLICSSVNNQSSVSEAASESHAHHQHTHQAQADAERLPLQHDGPIGQHDHLKCPACASCCMGAAISVSVLREPALVPYVEQAFTFDTFSFSSHIPDYPDRPPRVILV